MREILDQPPVEDTLGPAGITRKERAKNFQMELGALAVAIKNFLAVDTDTLRRVYKCQPHIILNKLGCWRSELTHYLAAPGTMLEQEPSDAYMPPSSFEEIIAELQALLSEVNSYLLPKAE